MDNQNRKLELLGNAPIPKALLAMGIPTMIGMLINALYKINIIPTDPANYRSMREVYGLDPALSE